MCKLDKYASYDVSEVIQDGSKVVVKLIDPPKTCPEGTFASVSTILLKDADVHHATLHFSSAKNAPIVAVPHGYTIKSSSDPADITTSSGLGFFGWAGIALVVGIFMVWVFNMVKRSREEEQLAYATANNTTHNSSTRVGTTGYVGSAPVHSAPSGGGTTVINNGGHNDGFFTGMLVGNMMSGGHHDSHVDHTIIEEHRTVVDHESSSDSSYDDNDKNSGYDSSSSYDDGGSSSYSDSGSSYDDGGSSSFSDSGSDFGGGDCGGGSFGD